MAKNKWLILLAVLLLLAASPAVYAAELGSIQVCDVEGTVTLYPVASADGTLKTEFADVSLDISDEAKAVANAKALWSHAKSKNLPGQNLQADAGGNVLFSPLEQGLYLIGSASEIPEFDPFLVRIPTMINGNPVLHIQAKPKQEEPDPTKPTTPSPETPSQNIPQTGNSVIPKYMLMGAGTLVTLIGLYQMIAGKDEEAYE